MSKLHNYVVHVWIDDQALSKAIIILNCRNKNEAIDKFNKSKYKCDKIALIYRLTKSYVIQ